MYVVSHHSLEHQSLPGIDHVTLAGNSDGIATLSIWKQKIAPHEATPPHRHDCEEVILIESGSGDLHIDGQTHRFGPNTSLIIPANRVHQIVNSGDEPLCITAALGASPVEVFLPDGEALPLPWRT